MVSGAHKVWTNPVLGSGPATMLRRSLFGLDETEGHKALSHALACRGTEAIHFETTVLSFSRIERFIGMPEPTVLIREAVREMAERNNKISLGVRECAPQTLVIKHRVRSYKKVGVFIVRFLFRLNHNFH